jgi:hypothetical protein
MMATTRFVFDKRLHNKGAEVLLCFPVFGDWPGMELTIWPEKHYINVGL